MFDVGLINLLCFSLCFPSIFQRFHEKLNFVFKKDKFCLVVSGVKDGEI